MARWSGCWLARATRAVWFGIETLSGIYLSLSMPPILTPLPRRLSSTHSPSPASSVDTVASLLNPSHIQRKLRNAPLRVEVDYVKPTISATDRMGTAFADSPAIAVNFEAGDMEDWCSYVH